jgi:AcrR family transcriptional regulator
VIPGPRARWGPAAEYGEGCIERVDARLREAIGGFLTSVHTTSRLLTVLETPNRDRAAERRASTRREILDAAWELAHEVGLAEVTLRALAHRIGMRAPSLYSYFDSKNAVYDAMFGEAWTACLEVMTPATGSPSGSRAASLRHHARAFFDFAVADPARYQLMNQRTIVGFTPSPDAYAPSLATLESTRALLARYRVTRREDLDLYVALIAGLIDAQLANDPGGSRWRRLLDRAVDMFDRDLGEEPQT